MGQAIVPKVVVVEDDPDLRSLAAALLEESDMDVVELETADEAIAYMRRHGHDVAALFVDLNLPGAMDGMDLARTVHMRWPETVIIATSGNPQDRLELLPRGTRYFQKPWRALDVMIAVERAAALRC
jgi:two-component system, response regulator PdtaR